MCVCVCMCLCMCVLFDRTRKTETRASEWEKEKPCRRGRKFGGQNKNRKKRANTRSFSSLLAVRANTSRHRDDVRRTSSQEHNHPKQTTEQPHNQHINGRTGQNERGERRLQDTVLGRRLIEKKKDSLGQKVQHSTKKKLTHQSNGGVRQTEGGHKIHRTTRTKAEASRLTDRGRYKWAGQWSKSIQTDKPIIRKSDRGGEEEADEGKWRLLSPKEWQWNLCLCWSSICAFPMTICGGGSSHSGASKY